VSAAFVSSLTFLFAHSTHSSEVEETASLDSLHGEGLAEGLKKAVPCFTDFAEESNSSLVDTTVLAKGLGEWFELVRSAGCLSNELSSVFDLHRAGEVDPAASGEALRALLNTAGM
jgi:hypothetical protein